MDMRLQLVVQHAQRTRQHVWTPVAWMELLTEVQKGLGFELEAWHVTSREILTVSEAIISPSPSWGEGRGEGIFSY